MLRKIVKMMTLSLLLVSASFAANADQAAPSLKIGVINVQQIMQKSPMVIALNKKLQDQFQPRQAQLVKSQSDLQAEVDKLNKNGAVMSTTDRSQLQDKIIADRASLQAAGQSFQSDLNAAQTQAMQQFMGKLQSAVNVVAANGKYDLILQRSGTPYVNNALDITSLVMAQLPSN